MLKGSLRLNTDSCYMAFVDAGQDEIDALEEGKVTFPGKSPRVFFQRKVRLKKSISSETLLQSVRTGAAPHVTGVQLS